jgi:serine protease inhibitor
MMLLLLLLAQVYVHVDEEGTEAAAVTFLGTGATSAPTVQELVSDI